MKDTLEEAERWVAPQKKYIAKDVSTIGAWAAAGASVAARLTLSTPLSAAPAGIFNSIEKKYTHLS